MSSGKRIVDETPCNRPFCLRSQPNQRRRRECSYKLPSFHVGQVPDLPILFTALFRLESEIRDSNLIVALDQEPKLSLREVPPGLGPVIQHHPLACALNA